MTTKDEALHGALERIAEKLTRAGARVPAPEVQGTIESSITTGLSIALLLVKEEQEALAAIDEAQAQPAPTPELPPLPDERAAFEDLLDAAEEWERFVDVDRAPMNLRKWLERAALAQRSAETSEVRALREENARLRGDCVEWLCARCQTIHPSQRGRTFLQPCPECGEAMEPTSFNIRALKRMDAIIEAARAALEALELHAKQYPHMQKGYTVDAIDALSAALPAHQKEQQ